MNEPKVRDIMSQPVYSLGEHQSLPVADELMRLRHVRHIPVVDQQHRLVGLITHRDLLGAHASSAVVLGGAARSDFAERVAIGRIMQREVWSISPDAGLLEAVRLLLDHKFGCLPVVENEVLVGILTETDLLRHLSQQLEQGRELDEEDTNPDARLRADPAE
jgi:CBS domain-containing membrane protein